MFVNRRMSEENVLHIHNGRLCNCKEKLFKSLYVQESGCN